MSANSVGSVLKRISLIFTMFSGQFISDPNGLLSKIAEKLRTQSISLHFPTLPSPSASGESLLGIGELSASLKEFRAAGLRGRMRSKQIARQLEEISTPIAMSKDLSSVGPIKNVLVFLTNSIPYTQSGYTERSQKVLSALKREGFNVRGVTRLGYPVVVGRLFSRKSSMIDGIMYSHLLPWKYPWTWEKRFELAVKSLVTEAQAFQADVIHTTTDFKNALVASHAALELGIPWVYETRGELQKTWLSKIDPTDRERASNSEFYRKASFKELDAMSGAAAVLCLSDVSKANFVSFGVPVERFRVIPNAISGTDILKNYDKQAIRKSLGLTQEFLVGTITSVVGYEGLDDLLRAISILKDAYCIIVGDGQAKPLLKKLANDLGISDRVKFVGKQPSESIWRWYAALDAFVVPRKDLEVCRTVTPIKSLRAQALGVPVVASDLPALREVTGNSAIYVIPEDAESIAAGVERIQNLTASDLAIMQEKGYTWVQSRTWENNAKLIGNLYRPQV